MRLPIKGDLRALGRQIVVLVRSGRTDRRDGPATASGAYLCYPYGVAVDSTGNVYIADSSNLRIRQVNTSGIINTVAGNGTFCNGYSNNPCGDGGAVLNASLSYYIYSLAADGAGNVFIADS